MHKDKFRSSNGNGSDVVQTEAEGRGPPPPPHNCCPTCGGRLGTAKSLLDIMREVGEKHNVPIAEIRGPRRPPRIAAARSEFFVRAYFETTQCTSTIARFCGDRDHSCVNHALKGAKRKNNRGKGFWSRKAVREDAGEFV